MRLEKWQALGNDYLIVERESLPWELTPSRVRLLCNPHFGLGADGICELSEADDGESAARLAIFNPDGTRAEISGNGVREAALYLHGHGRTAGDIFGIQTDAGSVMPEVTSPNEARVSMGIATTASDSYPDGEPNGVGVVRAGGTEWEFRHVSIGNPQCAIEVDAGLEDLDLPAIGPEIESAELFPNKTNVSFWFRLGEGDEKGSRIRARIFERGVGETLSSGTGATGAAVAAHLAGAASPVEVVLDGGSLLVEIDDQMGILLSGWATAVYTAEPSRELLDALSDQAEPPALGNTP
jgi:diaminopimelate epimerase